MKVTITLFRGLNGTNPSAFRVDNDGVSVFEESLADYKYNLPIQVMFEGQKTPGITANLIEPMLTTGIAVYTPEFGDGHWSLRFPGLTLEDVKNLLSKYAKAVLK